MAWVKVENCSLSYPEFSNCMRPLEFTEPILCVNKKLNIPNDLLQSPDLQQSLIIACLLLLCFILAIQVNYFWVLKTIFETIFEYYWHFGYQLFLFYVTFMCEISASLCRYPFALPCSSNTKESWGRWTDSFVYFNV